MHRPQLLSGKGLRLTSPRPSPRSRSWCRSARPTVDRKKAARYLPRNKYTAIRDDKPKSKDDAKRPEFKVCKFTTEAIITEGSDVGTIHKVCANPILPGPSSEAANQPQR